MDKTVLQDEASILSWAVEKLVDEMVCYIGFSLIFELSGMIVNSEDWLASKADCLQLSIVNVESSLQKLGANSVDVELFAISKLGGKATGNSELALRSDSVATLNGGYSWDEECDNDWNFHVAWKGKIVWKVVAVSFHQILIGFYRSDVGVLQNSATRKHRFTERKTTRLRLYGAAL